MKKQIAAWMLSLAITGFAISFTYVIRNGNTGSITTGISAGYDGHSMTVILDDAHGADVAGKGSPDGRHKEFAWSTYWTKELGRHLTDIGFKVVYTAPEETEPGLWTRVSRMNAIPPPAFVLSLHNNAAGMGTRWELARGFSVWTTKGVTRSDQCADILFMNLRNILPDIPFREDMSDGDHDWEANFIVLLSKHPSVLLEYLFQDNELDLLLIENPQLCRTVVEIIDISMIQIERYLLQKQTSYEKILPFGRAISFGQLQPTKAA